jgi:RNA polymerase sigma-70 factor (ECF subfamily)
MPLQQRFSGIESALAERLYRDANADRWRLPRAVFTAALETSCAKAFAAAEPGPRERERYLASLHLEDLALACACALGDDAAWDHFVLEMRPRSTGRQTRSTGREARVSWPTRSMRTSYGVGAARRERQSLFRYFHGRSSLATWLRAVLAQRHVDRVRVERRTDPLPEELPAKTAPTARDPDCARFLELLRTGLETVTAALDARDRLRLGCYYAQQLTLAQTGKAVERARGNDVATARADARAHPGRR